MASEFGFVYVLSNKSMPGVFKIGMTTRSPSARALELSKWTGVASPFVVEYYAEFEAPKVVERQVHGLLDKWRVNNQREFFCTSLDFISEVIEQHCPVSSWESSDLAFVKYQSDLDMQTALEEIDRLVHEKADSGEVVA